MKHTSMQHLDTEDIQRESFKAVNVKSLQSTEIQQSKNKLKDLKKFGSRFSFVHSKFSQIDKIFKETKEKEINGFVFDIGVSSMQLDDANRGFSFMQDGPLDMRMSQDGQTASDLINKKDKDELADIIYHYGDERNSRKIARNIEKNRTQKKLRVRLSLQK